MPRKLRHPDVVASAEAGRKATKTSVCGETQAIGSRCQGLFPACLLCSTATNVRPIHQRFPRTAGPGILAQVVKRRSDRTVAYGPMGPCGLFLGFWASLGHAVEGRLPRRRARLWIGRGAHAWRSAIPVGTIDLVMQSVHCFLGMGAAEQLGTGGFLSPRDIRLSSVFLTLAAIHGPRVPLGCGPGGESRCTPARPASAARAYHLRGTTSSRRRGHLPRPLHSRFPGSAQYLL